MAIRMILDPEGPAPGPSDRSCHRGATPSPAAPQAPTNPAGADPPCLLQVQADPSTAQGAELLHHHHNVVGRGAGHLQKRRWAASQRGKGAGEGRGPR